MENNKSKLFIFAFLFATIILLIGFISAAQSVVNLGTAGNFVILSKAGISTTGTTAITGDIGSSPIDSTGITGFGLIMDSTNTFATSSLVTGKIYAADYTSPTPTKMTTAVSDMETAYTDASGRTNPTATELGAGDISGKTIAPGLYKWGTGVIINDGVTLSGGANDVWIFQIAQDLTVGNGAIITLVGGAQAKNIFWQVGGQTTLGTTSDFKGIILSQTLIEINTGAVLKGRALAQTAVTLDANVVTSPGTASTTTTTTTPSTTTPSGSSSSSSGGSAITSGTSSNTQSEDTIITNPDESVNIVNGVSVTVTQDSETVKITSSGSKVKLNSGDAKVETELPVEVEGNTIRVTQSNGIKSEVKIMPDTASETALERLKINVCSEENNCTIVLKEVGTGEQMKLVYEIKVQKESKLLWVFKKQMQVSAQVNAENGEIIRTGKSWWAFMAVESVE
ncbi:DUF3494 domain-containing protein [Candidatus Pacearchaeota archaeon]|nr:DUF3494 domain-containing protein [Candidatus Pacearchaeota archaeon]